MRAIQLIIFLLITVCFSCEKEFIAKCDECTPEEPENAKLYIKIFNNPNSASTDVYIYEGDLEDNIIFTSFSLITDDYTIFVPLNKKYTVAASYTIGNEIYTVVDSAFPRIKYEEEQCDDPCYFVYDNKINLKLKYY